MLLKQTFAAITPLKSIVEPELDIQYISGKRKIDMFKNVEDILEIWQTMFAQAL